MDGANSVLSSLVDACPDFIESWDSTDNLFSSPEARPVQSGVWAQFSLWFREAFPNLSNEQLARIGGIVNAALASEAQSEGVAVSACFLENIAGEPAAEALTPYLSKEAVSFLSQFMQPPNHSLQADVPDGPRPELKR